ncbi:MAG TPA: sulfotransferase [Candidatus Acidoferrum sp.]|nr:sulfotransferase [Candidatus Acidoferrum sp.]
MLHQCDLTMVITEKQGRDWSLSASSPGLTERAANRARPFCTHRDQGKPDVFIVGAPKSGTTAMDHYLAGHPQIFMARKEMHAFGADLQFGAQFYRRDRAAYLAEFAPCQGRLRAGESSVWYLFSRKAAAEIRAFNPEARIIIMLREPAEMLYSLFSQFRFDGNECLPSFEEALAAEDDRRAGRRLSRQTYFPQGLVYRDTARYTEQVQRYFDVFGREQVHVIIYDDLKADPRGTYCRVLEFLEVDPTHVPANFQVINGNKTVKHSALRSLLNDPLLRSTAVAIGRRLPRPVFNALHDAERRLWKFNTRPEKRASLAPETRARLRQEFAPEVKRLSALLGRDLTHWSE